MKKWGIRLLKAASALLLLFVVVFGVWLENATVVRTSGGVYQAIMLPLSGGSSIRWRADFSITADKPNIQHIQGPIVERKADKSFAAQWVCGNSVHTAEVGEYDPLKVTCGDKAYSYDFYPPAKANDAATFITDGPVAVTSDLEGNLGYFLRWGIDTGVLNAAGNWAFGGGHLVVAGDMFDRGRYVYDLLWFLYDLEQQAEAYGGKVHILLGNHEQYAFIGLIKSVEAEHLWAIEQMMPYPVALRNATVLGQWLRTKPVMAKINNVLYMHGGISELLLKSGKTIEELNALNREALDNYSEISDDVFALTHGNHSLTQYRGYAHAMEYYPEADQSLIDRTKQQFGVDYLVVGHSQAETLAPKFGGDIYIVENTHFSKEALVFEEGQPVIKQLSLLKERFEDNAYQTRSFSLFNMKDLKAFFGIFSAVSRVPER
ncbi:metallophosphoesterase [Kordiimonas laminariae]|uniref:metallophosphoesterase n=1 Tax=Kordiimonas laminariae TaxID=2917717 RepID=UPI001FF6A834|nr:metallophosphoesterase [Kordiimonas laminariae]